jgi:hypothetical protein
LNVAATIDMLKASTSRLVDFLQDPDASFGTNGDPTILGTVAHILNWTGTVHVDATNPPRTTLAVVNVDPICTVINNCLLSSDPSRQYPEIAANGVTSYLEFVIKIPQNELGRVYCSTPSPGLPLLETKPSCEIWSQTPKGSPWKKTSPMEYGRELYFPWP